MSDQTYVVGPAKGHSHTVILLHGRDSGAEEFASEFFECEITGSPQFDRTLPAVLPTIRWVFPQAKDLPSERFGTNMSQWFDMWSVEHPQERSEIQVPGLTSSIETLAQIIKDEETLVPRSRIFLAGISQGFATVLATFLADGNGGFAGLCGFCSWLPLADVIQASLGKASDADRLAAVQEVYRGSATDGTPSTSLTSTRILLGHSRDDEVIPVTNGRDMRDMLQKLQFRNVQWHEYEEGGHWFNEPEGVDDLFVFLFLGIEYSTEVPPLNLCGPYVKGAGCLYSP
ncbi:alpha/beta-hydrolase [Coniochaeta ligniaria NRRL 30616]|uniref:Alpha/beta-hydrolase n=1 Tax=Coniochaeta ligniaria NRRL 30616 TaxID=1408157 RepID=A0A1J7I3W4_9PEZI|nr:alpha/beta-hydrolase [Coniochaeta ligniaria NRRL 30616]